MSDIFNEVDEEVRREQLRRIWERYSGLIVAVAVLIVLGVAGWRGYEYWQGQRAIAASATFEEAAALAGQGKTDEALAAFAKLSGDAPEGYQLLARFREAALRGQKDAADGAKAFTALAAERTTPEPLRDFATVRAGLLLTDTAKYDDLRTTLEGAAAPGRPFRHSARELLALSAWRAGDMASARRWAEQANGDADLPSDVRTRLDMLLAILPPEAKG